VFFFFCKERGEITVGGSIDRQPIGSVFGLACGWTDLVVFEPLLRKCVLECESLTIQRLYSVRDEGFSVGLGALVGKEYRDSLILWNLFVDLVHGCQDIRSAIWAFAGVALADRVSSIIVR